MRRSSNGWHAATGEAARRSRTPWRRFAGRAKPRDRVVRHGRRAGRRPANPELLALIADDEVHAPALIGYEVASALRGHALGGKIHEAQLEDAAP